MPTLQPIALAGPQMKVGTLWPYVDGSVLVAVPGGPFTMGHGGSDNPQHTVTLSDYWIYQAKVTNQQYKLCIQAGKCKVPDPVDDFTFADVAHANDPVVGVNYAEASGYCSFVHGQLPTEAQWEKAARGPDGNLYPWGNNAPLCDVLNFNNCVGKITNVTTYPRGQSYYHALDMEGNVFEWVADWYNALYYKGSPSQDPTGPDTGQQRSVRSSSYKSKVEQIPASTRFDDSPKDHRRDLGFRCVVIDPTFFAPLCQTAGQGSSNGADCPKVNIGLSPACQEGKVTVVITDDHSPDQYSDVTGVDTCTPKGQKPPTPHVFPQAYDCSSDTTIRITSVCESKLSGPATCGAHYKLNQGACEWDGTPTPGTNCLPGYTFDPASQCCAAPAGGHPSYSPCPLGSALGYGSGQPVCVPNGQAANNPSHTEFVHVQDPSTCTGGGKQGGGSTGACPAGQTYTCIQDTAVRGPICYCTGGGGIIP